MMSDDESPDESNSSQRFDREPPDREHLIKAYIQYSEESRYRDGLMHNSYYFVLIATVLFAGQILTLELNSNPLEAIRFGFALAAAGFVGFGIGVVMKTYNRKRINAEDQRQVLENALDGAFTESGLFKDYGDESFSPRKNDNPFSIQQTVIGRNKGLVERFFREILPISSIASILIFVGLLTGVLGFGIILKTAI